MKKFLMAVALAASALAGSVTAQAADLPQRTLPDPPAFQQVVQPFSWTGIYVGGEAAATWRSMPYTVWCETHLTDAGKSSKNGLTFGPVIAARYQFANNVVVGLLASYNLGVAKDKVNMVNFGNTIHLDAQIGYAIGRFLPYLSAGIASTNTKLIGDPNSFNIRRTGLSVGAGADYAVTDHMIVGLYGRHNQFGKKTTDIGGGQYVRTKYSTNEVGLRALWKF